MADTGMEGFDLETLSTEEVKGLAFFLALPHSDVQNAFDTMDSISRLIAREVDGLVYDQNQQEMTRNYVNSGVIRRLIIVLDRLQKFNIPILNLQNPIL